MSKIIKIIRSNRILNILFSPLRYILLHISRLKTVIEQFSIAIKENSEQRMFYKTHVPLVYAKGYSFSKFLASKGIKNLSVYCEEIDYCYGRQICYDISLCHDINVKYWISDKVYISSPVCPHQNLTLLMDFSPSYAEQLNEDDNILVLSTNQKNEVLRQIQSKCSNVYHINQILPDVWFQAMIGQHLDIIPEMHPYLPIITISEQVFPANKEHYSDTEIYISEKYLTRQEIEEIIRQQCIIPKTFVPFKYSADDILEMLNDTRSYISNGIIKMIDHRGSLVNIVNGHRITPNQPENAKHTIYVFGGCTPFGIGCPDNGTSSAHLQNILVTNGIKDYRVENYGMYLNSRGTYGFETMKSIPYKEGDILVFSYAGFFSMFKEITHINKNIFHIDTGKLFERPHHWGENVFFDLGHLNENGQYAVAVQIYKLLEKNSYFKDYKATATTSSEIAADKVSLCHEQFQELDKFLSDITPLRPTIGAIVVNCNPFTLGHRYLIEESARKCLKLFVFVVEEDKSVFPFEDRINLVQKGIEDISNVTVLPSGKFIISSLTFADYFGKSEIQDIQINPSMDVEIFGKYIAPRLGINIRFAGEEPLDNITRQYNDTMRKILPLYGIDFDVIARKESGGEVISASRVRALLDSNNFDEISKLVPATTLRYLENKYNSFPHHNNCDL